MYFKQIDEILSGKKTQTRRLCKPGQFYFDDLVDKYDEDEEPVFFPEGIYRAKPTDPDTWECEDCPTYTNVRALYIIGRTYAVVPGRGQPAVWWRELVSGGPYNLAREKPLLQSGWQPLRIRITAIRQERLQDMSEADARAEGVASVEDYKALWTRINGKTKGARWEDNPAVWVLTFEMVQEGDA
jgi:hypothetical protein